MMLPEDVERWLAEVDIPLRLACVSRRGWPAVLSLWYLYDQGKLYCATQGRAKVVDYLRKDPRCAFEISVNEKPYRGVRGWGSAAIEPTLGEDVLRRLLTKYLGGTHTPLAGRLLAKADAEVAIVITPHRWHRWDYTVRMKDTD